MRGVEAGTRKRFRGLANSTALYREIREQANKQTIQKSRGWKEEREKEKEAREIELQCFIVPCSLSRGSRMMSLPDRACVPDLIK
jgi:hypothetical protein